MTSPVEYRYNRAKVKPIAGGPIGVSEPKPVASVPAAPESTQAEAPVAGTPPVDNAHVAEGAEQFTGTPQTPPEPTGTAESAQAGQTPTAAPATSPETTVASETAAPAGAATTEVPADVIAFLKAHPDAEALIEKLAQGK